MWWIVGGVLLVWVVCAIPIAILFGRAIAKRDRAEFTSRNQAWADRTVALFEADASSERPQNDRRNPPLIG